MNKICVHSKLTLRNVSNTAYFLISLNQGIRIKGREMALVWHEKASRTALRTSLLSHTYIFLVQIHSMTTFKEIAEQCRHLIIIKLE